MSELIDNQAQRIQTLKEVILHLHRGEAPEAVRERLAALVSEVDPSEIAAMEQQLMAEGMSPEEVRSMCDLHADVVKDVMAQPCAPRTLPPGHPVHHFKAENAALMGALAAARPAVEALAALPDRATPTDARLAALAAIQPLFEVDRHYKRKEHLVFSILERHGTFGPSKVMWGKDDEVRDLLKSARTALEEETLTGAELRFLKEAVLEPAFAALAGMVSKEENILFPMAMGMFTEEEWGEVFTQSSEYGWCLVEPAVGYAPPQARPVVDAMHLPAAQAVAFPSGSLTFDQLLALFNTLPVDLTFVDAENRVAWFSEGPERVFERSRAVVGRSVRNCHPPKSVHIVDRILEDFRTGRQSIAEFWIQMGPKFVHIRYFALRDGAGAYLGTLEVTQDLTRLRTLQGDRRLLQYEEA
ncbi:MAG: DUF438 domain-containing protein [Acidobacteria bacterium]|nr:DUF438 domain-containing protein [Acidobacteriota bacterium]